MRFLNARPSLKRKIIFLVALGMLLMFAALGVYSWLAINQSTDRVLQERLVLAQTTSGYLEYELRQNLTRLEDVAFATGVDIEDNELEPEKRALHDVFISSIFKDGVFLVDSQGMVLWAEPPGSIETNLSYYSHITQALETGRPVVSNVFTSEISGKRIVAAVVPLRNRSGKLVGAVGGTIDPTGNALSEIIQPVRLGKTGYIEVVDGRGIVLASTKPERILQISDHSDTLANLILGGETTVGTCHSCHEASPQAKEKEVMAFAPLSGASWGVAVRQSEHEALAPARNLRNTFIGFSAGLLVVSLALAWGLGRSLAKPLGAITQAAERIAKGDLSTPVPPLGDDEIGQLAQSFDTMRQELKASLGKIQRWNRELEEEVKHRTKELEASYQEIQRRDAARGELLRRVITAQEEERKRVARELHDDTSQALAVLLMALGDASRSNQTDAKRLDGMKDLAAKALYGVHQMIFDLRPAVLDDLGLTSALRWYAQIRLKDTGIRPRLEVSGTERRLPSQVETSLFRVVQETISNIAKHSEADNVIISLDFKESAILVEVEDDGNGFDLEAVSQSGDKTRGLGLLGMRERIALLEGKFCIQSEPGGGTHISIEVPLPKGGADG